MIRDLWSKIKEAVISILPVTLMIILLSFTPLYSLKSSELITFIISAIVLMLGIGLFSLGADIAMQPMGETVGSSLIKTKKLPLIINTRNFSYCRRTRFNSNCQANWCCG